MDVSIEDFLMLRQSMPMIDVRSEGEFAAGHIRGAINIPILNDSERVVVGTTYKQVGQKAAIREGFRLVGPRMADIIEQTETAAQAGELLVHCWRGGMRSSNFSQLVGMARIRTRTLTGGYKSYRRKALDSFRHPLQLVLLTGFTGSGKSEVLRALGAAGEQILDLEGLAHHKGSAFGGLMMPAQPTTEQFQNDLFEELIKLDFSRRIWVEDESIAIGKIFLPTDLWQQMTMSPVVRMEVDKSVRIGRLVNEYGSADRDLFHSTMMKITKKLGGQNFNAAREKLYEGDMSAVIDILLTNYYDKAYLDSITRKMDRIILTHPWDGKNAMAVAHEMIGAMTDIALTKLNQHK